MSYTPISLNDDALNETLVGAPPSSATASSVPVLEIVAPSDLPGGYELTLDDGSLVTIPAGGVEAGQTFRVPMMVQSSKQQPTPIPVGAFRDGLGHCFHYGLCHPHLWTAVCCPTST